MEEFFTHNPIFTTCLRFITFFFSILLAKRIHSLSQCLSFKDKTRREETRQEKNEESFPRVAFHDVGSLYTSAIYQQPYNTACSEKVNMRQDTSGTLSQHTSCPETRHNGSPHASSFLSCTDQEPQCCHWSDIHICTSEFKTLKF